MARTNPASPFADQPPDQLQSLLRTFSARGAGTVIQSDGQWVWKCWVPANHSNSAGPPPSLASDSLPGQLIVRAIDDGQTSTSGPWCACPLPRPDMSATSTETIPRTPMAMVVHWQSDQVARSEEHRRLAEAWAFLEARDHEDQRRGRRTEQLAKVVRATATWQTIDDADELLGSIADVATKVIDCERSSIFLWHRRDKKLVANPALGVEGGKLEVADDAGVVGRALKTESPVLWHATGDDENEVNRSVDRKLKFRTDSLAAVPMRSPDGKVVGVFEAINKHRGRFDAIDVQTLQELALHAAAAIRSQGDRRQLAQTADRLISDAAADASMIGEHPSIEAVRQRVAKVAATELSVLIRGEAGTGKEVVAKQLHYHSDRRSGPFVAVNCAALVETLLESELFGHRRGAFTDAHEDRIGKFELAAGGTLFLDEIGDMSPGGQAKLLRVLEEKVVVPVGGSESIPVDVRVLAATNQPLEELIAAGRFRQDLYFRLNVVTLDLPRLADRGSDVLMLADHFLDHFAAHIGRPRMQLSESARRALLQFAWPGNVRQLRNTIERATYLADGPQIEAMDLDLPQAGKSASATKATALKDATREFQVSHIETMIASTGRNMTDAAAKLGLHRSNLYRKMRQLGMPTSGRDAFGDDEED